MRNAIPKSARAIAALIVLAVVVLYASGVVGRYRAATAGSGGETTATAAKPTQPEKKAETAPAEKAPTGADSSAGEAKKPSGPAVVVKVDGLNFRREPKKDAEVIRGLNEGERLTLIKTEDGWHYAEDSGGEKGWLYGSEQYSTVEE